MARAKACGPNQSRCNLCCKETLLLMDRGSLSLNKREEMGGYCPHKRAHLICAIKSNKEVMKIKAVNKKKFKKARIKQQT